MKLIKRNNPADNEDVKKMRCPYCGSFDDKVTESRQMANGESIRRRRQCISCGHRFTSYEKIEEKPFMVVKRDGRRQPFDIKKVAKGIERALEKRPVSTDFIDLIVNELNSVDKVAYIRFASVYRHFTNLEEFITEVKKISER